MLGKITLKMKLIFAFVIFGLILIIATTFIFEMRATKIGEEVVTEEIEAQLLSINANKKNALKLLVGNWPNQIKSQQTRRICANAIEDYRLFLEKGEKTDTYLKYSKMIDAFVKENGYYDMFIIDKDGLIVYTAAKESDYGTNILTGKYKDSGLANAVKRAMDGEIAYEDFESYEPSNGDYAAFYAAPILKENEQIGVVALQMSSDKINGVVQERTGLRKTGESYIVGKLHGKITLRSDRVIKKSKIGKPKKGKIINLAFKGETGVRKKIGSTGKEEFVAYTPLDFGITGINWVLITTVSTKEMLHGIEDLSSGLMTLGIILLIIMTIFSFIVAWLFSMNINNGIKLVITKLENIGNNIKNGKLNDRVIAEGVIVDFVGVIDSINEIIDSFVAPLNITSDYLEKISIGNIPPKIDEEYKGDFDKIRKNLNSLIFTIANLISQTNLIISKTKSGNLEQRADASKFSGEWEDLVKGINNIVNSMSEPFELALNFIDDVSNGRKLQKINKSFNGKYEEMKININSLADIINIILSELTFLTNEIRDKGMINQKIDLSKIKGKGSWESVLSGVNDIANALALPINTLSNVLISLGNGIIPNKITSENKGNLLEIKNATNNTIDNFIDLQKAGTYLKKLAVNDFSEDFSVNYKGIFSDLKDSINDVKGLLSNIQNVTGNIAIGNLSDLKELKSKGKLSEKDKLVPSLINMMEAIANLVDDANTLAKAADDGNLDLRADSGKHKGEYKEVINGINAIFDNLVNPLKMTAEFIEKTSRGVLSEKITIETKGDYTGIVENMNNMTDKLSLVLNNIMGIVKDAKEGNLKKRIDSIGLEGVWSDITKGINETIDNIINPINEAVSVIEKMADGDLSDKIVGNYKGDHAILKNALNATVDNLNNLLNQVNNTVEQVNGGASQVSDASQSLSQGATEQAASLEEISSAMTEIGSQSKHNAENAGIASKLSIKTRNNADAGSKQMNELEIAMKNINESSNKIKKVIKVIDDIAFQTNLLAINAAVEAARAGVHGKGFAVVASEVRNLAQKSAKAAEETTELIEGSIKEIESGNELSGKTAEFLNTIVDGITKVTDIVEEISVASDEQNKGISQSIDAIEQVSKVTQQNAANSEETASASVELTSQAGELKSMIAKFKLDSSLNSSFEISSHTIERRQEVVAPKNDAPALEYNDDFGEF